MRPIWLQRLQELGAQGEGCVLVTVAAVRGSAPREAGAKMVVSATEMQGSIGGGQLEYRCVRLAVASLRDANVLSGTSFSRTFPLGPDCGQCCGGVVDVLFEVLDPANNDWLVPLLDAADLGEDVVLVTPVDSRAAAGKMLVTAHDIVGNAEPQISLIDRAREMLESGSGPQQQSVAIDDTLSLAVLFEPLRKPDFDVVIFGAGHVGTAIVTILGGLDCNVHWIDSRPEVFPQSLPANVRALPAREPATLVKEMPAGAYYLVMTHSHPLDLELCQQILGRDDVAYCGLIGSRSKRNRFEKRLRAIAADDYDPGKLTCPIGLGVITGKKPMEIAVAVAAELLSLREQRLAGDRDKPETGRTLMSAVTQ